MVLVPIPSGSDTRLAAYSDSAMDGSLQVSSCCMLLRMQ